MLLLTPTMAGGPAPRPDPVAANVADRDRPALEAFARRTEAELREDILPFWLQQARDRTRGGFFGEISNDLVVRQDASRGALLSARILWTFSAAYRRYHDPDYLEMARWAYADLETRFWDREHGGYVWLIAANGTSLDQRKQVYGQAFGIYALAEYFRASGEQAALDRAIELYRLLEQHSRDRQHGGYLEAFTREWKRADGQHLSALEMEAPKSQNTHLHLMEAYTNLLRAWPDPGLRRDQRELVEVMLTRVLDREGRHLQLFFDADWTPRSNRISFGHNIEASWLLTEAAEVLGDAELLARVKSVALTIARAALAEGVDADGGLFNEAGPRGLTDTGKDWWPQAEAAVGFVNAYRISGEPQFLAAAQRSWDFIEKRLIDHEHGEWFWGVTRDGAVRPRTVKVGFWKCPYHDGRACMELAGRLRALATVADSAER